MRMTNEERQLLKDTAENLLRLLNRWDDTIGGMTIAISELYRAASTSPSRKIALLGRLRLHRDLMAREGKGVKYLSDLIEELDKWAGYQLPDGRDVVGSAGNP
jgi:hypothetical protein